MWTLDRCVWRRKSKLELHVERHAFKKLEGIQ